MDRRSAVREHHLYAGYRHEAMIYAGMHEFGQGAVPFLRDGIAAGEPALVVVSQEKIDLIRGELGADADAVTFADMSAVGSNPGRIIAVWYAFLTDHGGPDQPIRGIGEPIDNQRSPATLSECQLHEALLNLAFENTASFWLLCPYDLDGLADEVVAHALSTHPFIASGADRRESTLYHAPDPMTIFAGQLSAPPASATRIAFGGTRLAEVRVVVSERADAFGFSTARSAELVVAVNEIATNAIEHGGGGGELAIWTEGDTLLCEVADAGRFDTPLAGRIPPALAHDHGRGLWIANQLCDLIQIRSAEEGTVVRAHMRLDD